MTEVLIPPWIQPQAETSTLLDDTTSVFRAAYAPGLAQRVSTIEPRVQVKQSFKSLRGFERAGMLGALRGTKGKFATVWALTGYSNRGAFPTTELLSNGTFANGTTGWTGSGASIAVADRMLRLTVQSRASGVPEATPTIAAASQYSPYVSRVFFGNRNRGSIGIGTFVNPSIAGIGGDYLQDMQGLDIYDFVALQTTLNAQITYVFDSNGNVALPGDWLDIPFASVTRCALVDNSPNAQLFGEGLDNAAWTKNHMTVTPNAAVAPNGAAVADALVEDSTTNPHYITTDNITKSANPEDWCAVGFFHANSRSQVVIEVGLLGTNYAQVIVNLNSGAIVSGPSVSGTASNARAYVVDCSNGWYYVALVATIPATVTTTNQALFGIANAGAISYLGNGSGIYAWRCGFAKSSHPFNPDIPTVTALPVGTPQRGNILRLKGLPVSTAGLLLAGDQFQVGGELKQVTSQLDSDAAGKGSVVFGPALTRSPADGDPVIMAQPMGKFMLAENASWDNQFGVYLDVDITLEAIDE